MVCAACRAGAGAEPAPVYVADALAERIVWSKQGWGTLGLNTAVRPRTRAPSTLRIVGGARRHVAQCYCVEMADVDPQFHGRRADQDVQRVLIVTKLDLQFAALLARHLSRVLGGTDGHRLLQRRGVDLPEVVVR